MRPVFSLFPYNNSGRITLIILPIFYRINKVYSVIEVLRVILECSVQLYGPEIKVLKGKASKSAV